MNVLVAGWFSFEQMGATAGDILARDLACQWLQEAAVPHDVAVAPPFQNGVDWRQVDPAAYTHVLFVCGPFGNGWPLTAFLDTFAGRRLVGLNLSMLESLDVWNPFDALIERDSSRRANPDITFLSRREKVPVVGAILVHPQKEYADKARHDLVENAIRQMFDACEMSIVPIDTRLDENATGLRTASEVESLIARMDLVVTTRLHGMVLALKNGIPAIAIDPIAGGAKIYRQAWTIGWPMVFTDEMLSLKILLKAVDYCLSAGGRQRARECAAHATEALAAVRQTFARSFSSTRSAVRI